MQLSIEAICDVGSVRSNNEDMVAVSGNNIRDDQLKLNLNIGSGDRFYLAVADGMGGHNGGEVASEMVLNELDNFVHELSTGLTFGALKSQMDSWVLKTHQKVINRGKENPELLNMGTTLVGLLFYEGIYCFFNAGDSRLYRMRQHLLKKLTTDHSMREMGGDPDAPSNIILNAIGAGDDVFIDCNDISQKIINNDIFLLCSDGLSDLLEDDTIESLLNKGNGVDELISTAKSNGGKDNISIIVARIGLP